MIDIIKHICFYPFYGKSRLLKFYLYSYLYKLNILKPTNNLVQVEYASDWNDMIEHVSFRDTGTDIRFLYYIFENDYSKLLHIKDIEECKVFLDIGANAGFVSRWMRDRNHKTDIYCVEPVKENCITINSNVEDVGVYCCAIGSKNGEIELDTGFGMVTSLDKKFGTKEKTLYKMATLDKLFGNLKEISILKLDIEGMEYDALLGANEVLKKTKIVVGEMHSKELFNNCDNLLRKNGFYLDRMNGDVYLWSKVQKCYDCKHG